MKRDYFPTAYKGYPAAAKITGLSEIKLHQLRVAKVARVKNSGYPDYVPLINVEDAQLWMERTGYIPSVK